MCTYFDRPARNIHLDMRTYGAFQKLKLAVWCAYLDHFPRVQPGFHPVLLWKSQEFQSSTIRARPAFPKDTAPHFCPNFSSQGLSSSIRTILWPARCQRANLSSLKCLQFIAGFRPLNLRWQKRTRKGVDTNLIRFLCPRSLECNQQKYPACRLSHSSQPSFYRQRCLKEWNKLWRKIPFFSLIWA